MAANRDIRANSPHLPRYVYAAVAEDAVPLALIANLEGAITQMCSSRYGGAGHFRRALRRMSAILVARGIGKAPATRFFEGLIRHHPDYLAMDDHRSILRVSPRDQLLRELNSVLEEFQFGTDASTALNANIEESVRC